MLTVGYNIHTHANLALSKLEPFFPIEISPAALTFYFPSAQIG